ncbi:MAG TPA: hypothetical protein VHO70_22850 [Chitinispirillaceae bacterium]|nr:hypothetical protein [Chitinispirillaceae bacterium]
MIKKLSCLCFLIGVLYSIGYPIEIQVVNDKVKCSLNGYGHFYFGQVARGTGIEKIDMVNKIWTENALGRLSLETNFDEKLKLVVGVEATIRFSWPIEKNLSQTKTAQPLVWLAPTYGLYGIENRVVRFEACAGYFEYKYNPDVRNLGEFMFRSATYPAYIITDFDYPLAKLLGLRLSLKLPVAGFSYDLLLTSETVFYPAMDWSASRILSYNIANLDFITIGTGISYAHLFSVYPEEGSSVGSYTSPRYEATKYIDENGDTSYYTFKGTKLMGRISIDPLAFIRKNNTLFGKEDFKLYGEALIVGLESYPDTTLSKKPNPSYSDIREKTILTLGINLPSFSLLDVFNVELEYFGSKYYNDYRQIYVIDGMPLSPAFNEGIKESPWKWSVYLKKSFYNEKCAIIGQFARDHMRLFDVIYDHANHREMLVQAGDWWWATKIMFNF